jgi:hypothetical protein
LGHNRIEERKTGRSLPKETTVTILRRGNVANKDVAALDKVVNDRRADGKKTDRRKPNDRRKKEIPVAVDRRKGGRRSLERRRQVDPTTCEREYNEEEIEFMQAIEQYKKSFLRPFPTWSEVLEVVKSLGYRKVADKSIIVLNRAKARLSEKETGAL